MQRMVFKGKIRITLRGNPDVWLFSAQLVLDLSRSSGKFWISIRLSNIDMIGDIFSVS